MLLDGFVTDGELWRDLASGKALRYEPLPLTLAIAEAGGVCVFLPGALADKAVHDPVEDGGADIALALDDAVQRVEQFLAPIGLQKIAIHAGTQSGLDG